MINKRIDKNKTNVKTNHKHNTKVNLKPPNHITYSNKFNHNIDFLATTQLHITTLNVNGLHDDNKTSDL